MKYVIGIALVAILVFVLMFHVVPTDNGRFLVIPKENPSFAYTVVSVDDFLDQWNTMPAYERLQSGPMIYLRSELTKRKLIEPKN